VCLITSDDLAISEAIYEVERELKRDEHSSFDPMVVDIDAIDQDLRQVAPQISSESTAADGKSAEGA
jgi:division protein CdvB (Snf7/Vps24/ESCRT-III family)